MTRAFSWLSPAALLVGAGLLAAPASAAPAGALTGLQAPETSNVEHVALRRCYWHRGHRHCRRAFRRYGYYDYPYYEPYPYYYGYGPSIGFSFGGGRHFHGGHRHRGGGHFHGGGRGGHGHGRR
jgi:hypothetical protein